MNKIVIKHNNKYFILKKVTNDFNLMFDVYDINANKIESIFLHDNDVDKLLNNNKMFKLSKKDIIQMSLMNTRWANVIFN